VAVSGLSLAAHPASSIGSAMLASTALRNAALT
jgi:hypothetical protein